MGRLGMELEFAPRLLQPHCVGRMGKSVSSAELLVPSATRAVLWPSWIRRQLGLSSTELSAALSIAPSGLSSSVFTVESSGTAAAELQAAGEYKAGAEALQSGQSEAGRR